MSERLYKAFPATEGQEAQYIGCYVLDWCSEWTEALPRGLEDMVAFVEHEDGKLVRVEDVVRIVRAWWNDREYEQMAAVGCNMAVLISDIEALSTRAWCRWSEDSDGNWETQCGKIFVFDVGIPLENGFRYCPYCGSLLSEEPWQESDDGGE